MINISDRDQITQQNLGERRKSNHQLIIGLYVISMEKLKERITENSIDYILTGEYYIPDLMVEDEGYMIGRWGCMHRDYLKKKRPAIYSNMLLNGKLWKYLNDLDKQAEERFEILTKQMKQMEGVNENLKKTNQIKWIQMSYNIQNRAEEIVRNELIY